jgi:WhiB family redox-sensing transcriptional regulator
MSDHRLRDRRDEDWRLQAGCRDEDPELFFPIGTMGPALVQTEQALGVCRRCDVAAACLDWAFEHYQDTGIWGGTTEAQRRTVLRRRGAPVGSPRR